MMNKILTVILGFAFLLGLTGCSAGECSICGSTENTSSYKNLTTETKEAICEECMDDAMGSPDLCAWCQDEESAGFYVNLVEVPVFACQTCYDGLH